MEKKELIRKAAVRVMSERGFYNTKTSEIAEEAGVAVGTIYNYFKNKNDILDYIFAFELEKRLSTLNNLSKNDLTFWEKLEQFLTFHFREIKDNICVGEILVREKEFPRKNGSNSINKYLNMIPDILQKLLEEAAVKGEVKENFDPEIMSNIIFGSIQGIVERAISNNNPEMLKFAPGELLRFLKEGLNS